MFAFIMGAATAVLTTFGACAPTPHDATPARAACTVDVVDGAPVTTFMHDDPITCDVSPPTRLDIVWDATEYGDAQYAAAFDECDAMGGEPIVPASTWTRVVCEGVDY